MTRSPGLWWGLAAPLVCVVVIAGGQLLFKIASGLIDFRRPLDEPRGLVVLGVALALYGGATLLWVASLRHAPLGRVYPLMALSFVLVPLAAMFVLREQLSPQYWAGVALIVAGLAVIGRSWS
ncbi:EamA family transporter [Phenylobacterium sp.]|uniref:EamA family transporter n=1 Tax=Phenylobacterium sp. TaxID=1871053 RepID=UPI002EDA41AC